MLCHKVASFRLLLLGQSLAVDALRRVTPTTNEPEMFSRTCINTALTAQRLQNKYIKKKKKKQTQLDFKY